MSLPWGIENGVVGGVGSRSDLSQLAEDPDGRGREL